MKRPPRANRPTDTQDRLFYAEGERLSERLISEAEEDLASAAEERARRRWMLGLLFTTVAGCVAMVVLVLGG